MEFRDVIGSVVTVTVDRPLGSRHPMLHDMVYEVNYGYVEGVVGGDGEWQDAYILGIDEPVTERVGVICAIIRRRDDSEVKWVVAPKGVALSKEEIIAKTHFCERYFDIEVIIYLIILGEWRTEMSFEKLTEEFSAKLYEKKGHVIDFCIDEITLPNGQKAVREYIKHKGAAAVIPVDGEGNVYLVRQYRYAVGRETLEIPAGKLDSAEEDCREAAMRELREETGLCAKSLIHIGDYLGSPAINSEKIGLFLAIEFDGEIEGSLDDDEFLNVVKMPLSELCDSVMRGEIADGKTAYAALWAERYISGRGEN